MHVVGITQGQGSSPAAQGKALFLDFTEYQWLIKGERGVPRRPHPLIGSSCMKMDKITTQLKPVPHERILKHEIDIQV